MSLDPLRPFEQGGRCCKKCGHVLEHAERLGYRRQNHFVFTGYVCACCGREYRNPIYHKIQHGRHVWTVVMKKFDWTQIPFSTTRAYGGGHALYSDGGSPVYA